MNPNEKLPPGVARDDGTDRRAATDDILSEALAKRLSYDKAAAIAGVSSRTAARRMQDPEFRAMVHHRRQDWHRRSPPSSLNSPRLLSRRSSRAFRPWT